MIFADRDAIQKIIVEEDFRKSAAYERLRDKPDIATLFTETDKTKYKPAVRVFGILNSTPANA